jgi:hypothetical protein
MPSEVSIWDIRLVYPAQTAGQTPGNQKNTIALTGLDYSSILPPLGSERTGASDAASNKRSRHAAGLQHEWDDRADARFVLGVGVGKVPAHDLLLLPGLPPQAAA